MATKNGKQSLQDFVKHQLEDARERFTAFEKEAELVLKGLVQKGKAQRKELEQLIDRLNAGELFQTENLKQLSRRANQASEQLRRRLEELQSRVVEAAGVASQAQVQQLSRELSRLSKKVDALVGKKKAPEVRPPAA